MDHPGSQSYAVASHTGLAQRRTHNTSMLSLSHDVTAVNGRALPGRAVRSTFRARRHM